MYNKATAALRRRHILFQNTDMADGPVCYKISHFAGITGNSLQKIFISDRICSSYGTVWQD